MRPFVAAETRGSRALVARSGWIPAAARRAGSPKVEVTRPCQAGRASQGGSGRGCFRYGVALSLAVAWPVAPRRTVLHFPESRRQGSRVRAVVSVRTFL